MALFLFSSEAASAIDFNYGLRFGASFSRLSKDKDNLDASFASGIDLTGLVTVPLSSELELQIEFSYVQHGEKQKYSTFYFGGSIDIDETIKVKYYEIPILLRLPIDTSGSTHTDIFTGPFISVLNSDRRSGTYSFVDILPEKDEAFDSPIGNTKSVEFGIIFGGDITLKFLGRELILDVRYTRGLTNIFEDVVYDPDIILNESPMIEIPSGKAYEYKNRTITASVGILF